MTLLPLDLTSPVPLSQAPVWVNALPCRVAAGFPSPAEDHMVQRVDLMAQLIRHPQATFLLRVRGESMRDAGIFDNDVVMVDRAITPRSGQIVVAVVDGEFVCKTLYQRAGRIKLKAANVTFPDLIPKEGQTLEIWGVVVAAIKQFGPEKPACTPWWTATTST
jgi:DNA polymerase V